MNPNQDQNTSSKIPRAKQACDNCKLHKVKCDGFGSACSQCSKKKIDCVHSPPLKRGRKTKGENPEPAQKIPRVQVCNQEYIFTSSAPSSLRIQQFLGISQFYPFF